MKKVLFAVLTSFVLALTACGGNAHAADTLKGINQNGVQETVGAKHIFAVKSSGGVLSYRSAIGGGGLNMLSDSNGSQYSKAIASFGSGNAVQAADGWYYDLSKVKITCYNPQYTAVAISGLTNPDFIQDNCALAAQANSQ